MIDKETALNFLMKYLVSKNKSSEQDYVHNTDLLNGGCIENNYCWFFSISGEKFFRTKNKKYILLGGINRLLIDKANGDMFQFSRYEDNLIINEYMKFKKGEETKIKWYRHKVSPR